MSAVALLALGYALSLTACAFGLEWLSAHTHRRALRFRTAGFTYDDSHDFWVCPEGEHLWPHEFDRDRRLVRYRASPHVCNACPSKHRCTDSDRGREVVRPLDPWPHSEAGRFHRVIALTLVALAGLVLIVALAKTAEPADAAALVPGVIVVVLALSWLLRDLRTHPSNFPSPTPGQGVRFGVQADGDEP
jgi:hypothetical protein